MSHVSNNPRFQATTTAALVGCALALSHVIALSASSSEVADMSGIYYGAGSIDGMPYEGVVVIEHLEETYRLRWVGVSGTPALGIGLRDQDVLAVSYVGARPIFGSVSVGRDQPRRLLDAAGRAGGRVLGDTDTHR